MCGPPPGEGAHKRIERPIDTDRALDDQTCNQCLALAGLEPAVGLVNDVGAAATTDHAVIAVTVLERLQRVADLHERSFQMILVVRKIEVPPLWVTAMKVKAAMRLSCAFSYVFSFRPGAAKYCL